jgi:hypothetical protein
LVKISFKSIRPLGFSVPLPFLNKLLFFHCTFSYYLQVFDVTWSLLSFPWLRSRGTDTSLRHLDVNWMFYEAARNKPRRLYFNTNDIYNQNPYKYCACIRYTNSINN